MRLFEQWADSEGFPLTRSGAPGRIYLWDQTEWRWQGFQAALMPDLSPAQR